MAPVTILSCVKASSISIVAVTICFIVRITAIITRVILNQVANFSDSFPMRCVVVWVASPTAFIPLTDFDTPEFSAENSFLNCSADIEPPSKRLIRESSSWSYLFKPAYCSDDFPFSAAV